MIIKGNKTFNFYDSVPVYNTTDFGIVSFGDFIHLVLNSKKGRDESYKTYETGFRFEASDLLALSALCAIISQLQFDDFPTALRTGDYSFICSKRGSMDVVTITYSASTSIEFPLAALKDFIQLITIAVY